MEKEESNKETITSISQLTISDDHKEFAEQAFKLLVEKNNSNKETDKAYKDIDFSNIKEINHILNDDVIERFLIARENDLSKAFEMWKNWVEWRFTFHPESITVNLIRADLETGKAFLHGRDKEGRFCIIIKSGLHFPGKTTFENTMRLCVYWIEKIIKLADESGVKQIVAIVDRTNTGMSNIDYGMIGKSGLMNMLQDYYAERLKKVYILHVNWVYKVVYKLIKPFVATKTNEKICIMSKVDDLKEYFDEDQLLEEHGGKSTYKYTVPEN